MQSIQASQIAVEQEEIPSELPSPPELRRSTTIRVSKDFVDFLTQKGRKNESYEDVLWRLLRDEKVLDMLMDEERRKLETVKINLGLPDDLTAIRYFINDHYADRTKSFITGFHTIAASFEQWCVNVAENMPLILAGKDVEDWAKEEPKTPTLIIAAGPSVWRDDCAQLKLLANSKFQGSILCCDRILRTVLHHGVLPEKYASFTVCTVDSKEVVASWFEDPLIDKYADSIKMVSITSIHPKVLKNFKGEKFFFNGVIPDKILPNASHIHRLMTKKTVISTLGHVGGTCLILARMAKKPVIAYVGQDLSYLGGTQLRETDKFEGYVQMYGGRVHRNGDGRIVKVDVPSPDCVNRVKALYRRGVHPDFQTSYVTDYVFDSLRESVVNFIREDKERPEIYNCTEGGTLYGEGITSMYFKEFLKKHS